MSLDRAVLFFYAQAGYSYQPDTQTGVNGRLHGAIALANAERWARANGCYFVWDNDQDAEAMNESGEYEFYPAVSCLMMQHAEDPSDRPHVLASLSAIIESPNREKRDAYRRVIEAELALEGMS
jgi:hypothetical protein